GVSGNAYDTANAQEMQITLSGGLGEAEVGGPVLNIVPQTGGNTFKGSVFATGAGEWAQGTNIDDALRAQGATAAAGLIKLCDASFALGGRSEEHTSELQSRVDLVCRLLLEKIK